MKLILDDNDGRRELHELSFQQSKQAAAIVDCIGRLIPQEGVDYDVEVIFKGKYDPMVSMNIVSHTDKGEWWKGYVMKMISKYPPTAENPPQSIVDDVVDENGGGESVE